MFFKNKRRDFSIQPPRQQVDSTPFFVTDSANIDFTLENLNLTANLTTTGVTAGTYGSNTQVPVLVIDQWGRITGVTLQSISTSGLALETNGVTNGNQALLNLVAGTNMTITDDGLGNITFSSSGSSGGVASVNSGININVDNTDPLNPIINSLSDRYKTSSTTSNSVSNGTKTFTVDADLSYIPLQEVLVVHNSANHMHGEVVSYSGTTLVVDIKTHTGSGTYTSWVINLDGTPVDALTGAGNANELAYFVSPQVLASLAVASYPNLTELSYVKGVTSSIQTQINSKVPATRQVNTQHSLTGGGDLSADRTLNLVNDVASPGNSKTYSTNSSGTRGWYSIPQLTGLTIQMYQQDNYIAGTQSTSIEYIQTYDLLVVTNLGSNSVIMYNASTGEQLGSAITITNALKCRYIASINEIWVTSTTAASIRRISPTSYTEILPAITASVVANGIDILEYSSSKVFIAISSGSPSILVLNPSTLSVTATITTSVPSFPAGMCLNTNVSSVQYDRIIITSSNGATGIAILNPSTNSITASAVNPSSSLSTCRSIFYSSSQDKYYVCSSGNNKLIVISPATATTFTYSTQLFNQLFLNDLHIDDANDILFLAPMEGGTVYSVLIKAYKLSTLTPYNTFKTTTYGGASSFSGYLAHDTNGDRIFVVGRNTATNTGVCVIKYTF